MGFEIENGVLKKYIEGPGVTEVTIPDGVTEIGAHAFDVCKNLTSIIIPEGVTIIGHEAIVMCNNLTSIILPDSVTEIGAGAFLSCHSLTSINIPSNVAKIWASTFSYCCSLTSIKVASQNGYFSDIDGVLYNKEKTTLLRCPEGRKQLVIPTGIKEIACKAFDSCENLDLFIPDSVVAIDEYAFLGCFESTIIFANRASYAFEYAMENDITHREIGWSPPCVE